MVGLQVKDVIAELESGYLAPSCEAEGTVRSALFHPDGYSLWELEAELAAGSELRWGADHGDEVVFVLDGELELDGTVCDPQTAVIVEAGVSATARAVSDARVLHFGPAATDAPVDGLLGPALDDGRQVHLVGRGDAPQRELRKAQEPLEGCGAAGGIHGGVGVGLVEDLGARRVERLRQVQPGYRVGIAGFHESAPI